MRESRSRSSGRSSAPDPEAADLRLQGARAQLANDWLALKQSLGRETGLEPRRRTHLVWPILALAAGVAVGAGVWWRRSRE